MLDFASALYLGMQHDELATQRPFALTLGRPAALEEPPGAVRVAASLARLQGCEKALLTTSTLHLFWDLFEMLSRAPTALLVDACAYPVSRWAMQRVPPRGCSLGAFSHHDLASLRALAVNARTRGQRPVLVTDGYCGACGRSPPIGSYSALVEALEGLLVIDDTQSLGILGGAPDGSVPYGRGGGGVLRWHGVSGARIIVGASLAKAFGAPLAGIAGSSALIEQFRDASRTRVHCSPPSVAAIRAAQNALRINADYGDALRRCLHARVECLRVAMTCAGLRLRTAFPFPMQHFDVPPHRDAAALSARLLEQGVWAVATQGGGHSRLTFLVTVRHRMHDIELAGRIVARLLSNHAVHGGKENWNEQAAIQRIAPCPA
ncbi:aminotransferase class I/II-fold pyridoxal phosphate-dependent enzyme [Caballeronia sp. LZ035]|uniref:aminotransferase class I/II-fold pyridoxal phosphate-dependent enzyme n=1 Tax=Caballeronia sp. LZ035 TaxID=3038568 RepID=UPI0028582F26|nr:aminotransferase class I/II-fold pyridoxal phosphate-dependent enzyme [Caballeronia sp. LZ035]MDR5757123.1 aminotransferase class I/II-fold pyridoxal phosphate-dependent enzyme [Caballeronia sp. LZ035]